MWHFFDAHPFAAVVIVMVVCTTLFEICKLFSPYIDEAEDGAEEDIRLETGAKL